MHTLSQCSIRLLGLSEPDIGWAEGNTHYDSVTLGRDDTATWYSHPALMSGINTCGGETYVHMFICTYVHMYICSYMDVTVHYCTAVYQCTGMVWPELARDLHGPFYGARQGVARRRVARGRIMMLYQWLFELQGALSYFGIVPSLPMPLYWALIAAALPLQTRYWLRAQCMTGEGRAAAARWVAYRLSYQGSAGRASMN